MELFYQCKTIVNEAGNYHGQVRTCDSGDLVYHGYGILRMANGTSIAGKWHDGKCIRGTLKTQDGAFFEGDFTGTGKLKDVDGSVLYGLYTKDGKIEEGRWWVSMLGWMQAKHGRLEAANAIRAAKTASEQPNGNSSEDLEQIDSASSVKNTENGESRRRVNADQIEKGDAFASDEHQQLPVRQRTDVPTFPFSRILMIVMMLSFTLFGFFIMWLGYKFALTIWTRELGFAEAGEPLIAKTIKIT